MNTSNMKNKRPNGNISCDLRKFEEEHRSEKM
jgi:hypothetical protein